MNDEHSSSFSPSASSRSAGPFTFADLQAQLAFLCAAISKASETDPSARQFQSAASRAVEMASGVQEHRDAVCAAFEKLADAALKADTAISDLHRAFGAPGDYGYESEQGKSFYALVLAQAELRTAIGGVLGARNAQTPSRVPSRSARR